MATGFELNPRFIAFGLGAVAALAAAIEHQEAPPPESRVRPAEAGDPLRAELARCRTITLEDLEGDTACRAAWAENRRRFFAPTGDPG